MQNPGIDRTTVRAVPTISGRFATNPQPPFAGQGEVITKPMGDRNYNVQAFTGYPVSTVPKGQWRRGQIVQMIAPTSIIANGRYLTMYDPTDPRTWQNVTG